MRREEFRFCDIVPFHATLGTKYYSLNLWMAKSIIILLSIGHSHGSFLIYSLTGEIATGFRMFLFILISSPTSGKDFSSRTYDIPIAIEAVTHIVEPVVGMHARLHNGIPRGHFST